MFLLILALKDPLKQYFPRTVIGLIFQVTALTVLGALFYAALVLIMDDYARKIYREVIRSLSFKASAG
jgi:hypothetical protein